MPDQTAFVLRVPADTARALGDETLRADLGKHLKVRDPRSWQVTADVALDWLADQLVVERATTADRVPGVRLVEAERRHQLERGYDAGHDDRMYRGELLDMAGWWLHPDSSVMDWPWGDDFPEHGARIDDLVKAGALICAEIDRLLAAEGGDADA